MGAGASFEVGDHDFTKFSLVPSVALVNHIPSALKTLWYRGQLITTLKEGAFEPSSPLRHAAELKNYFANKVLPRIQCCSCILMVDWITGSPIFRCKLH